MCRDVKYFDFLNINLKNLKNFDFICICIIFWRLIIVLDGFYCEVIYIIVFLLGNDFFV